MQAIADLENSFKEFDRVLETGDKQAVPIRQQDALGYVGQIEEAMVKEFPYQVPSDYDYLPQLKVSIICCLFLERAAARAPSLLTLLEKGKQQAAMQGKHLLPSSHQTTTSQIDWQCLTANMGSAAKAVGSCHYAQLKVGCPPQGILTTRLHLQDQTLLLRNSLSDRRCAAPCLICAGKVPHSTVMCRAGPQWR